MKRARDNWAPLTALALFLIYFANVFVGAVGGRIFLSDVAEMLTLFASCIFFVAFILRRERNASPTRTENNNSH